MFSHGSHTPKSKAHLEIVPETKFVVFHGDEHNAQPATLKGVVRLHSPDAMSIKAVKIKLEGKRRIAWFYMGGMAAGEVHDKRVFYNETLTLGTPGTHKINKGVIEWPFEFTLNPSMPESVEGMANSWLVYNLFTTVERPGWNQKDIASQMHIRVVRTLGADAMEGTRSRTNADVWANKISYSISIPTDAVVFGTSIVADVELSPIRKGITLGKIDMRLIEQTTKRIQASEVSDLRADRVKSDEAEVAKAEMEFPEDSRVTFEDESSENPVMEDERYVFKARLPLPKTLKECRQDVDSHAIHISHRFKLMVNIHNPEGHVSQLVCRLPVKLFISPNLPIDEANIVQSAVNGLSEQELNTQEAQPNAPPEYGRHQLDELYSNIQPSGFMSRAPSGSATPAYALSRRGSSENLHNLSAIVDAPGQVSSAALQARLASLQSQRAHGHNAHGHGPSHSHSHAHSQTHSAGHASGHRSALPTHSPSGNNSPHNGLAENDPMLRPTPPSNHGGYFQNVTHYSNPSSPPHQSPHTSMPQSRRGSGDHSPPELHTEDYDLGTLSRVPSYGAAVRTPGPMTPFNDGPPTYFEATSRPPSPTSGASRPMLAPLRARTTMHSPLGAIEGSPTMQQNGFAGLHAGNAHEEQSRLNLLRARN